MKIKLVIFSCLLLFAGTIYSQNKVSISSVTASINEQTVSSIFDNHSETQWKIGKNNLSG
ncbi:Periplasmic beta-glucosidase, partial [termite gut metagenome]